jgi:hypothetical protein
MLEEHRDDVSPNVDVGPFSNNSLDGTQGLAHNLNLPSME